VTSLKKPREERDSPGKMSIAPEKKVIWPTQMET
jgi:hypothetical protein